MKIPSSPSPPPTSHLKRKDYCHMLVDTVNDTPVVKDLAEIECLLR